MAIEAMLAHAVDQCVPDWLDRQRISNKLAIEFQGEQWTYRQLYERAGLFAGTLKSLGIMPGDRIALLARHGLVFAATVHGVIQREGILVPLNTRLQPVELAFQLHDARVSILVFDSAHRELAMQTTKALTELQDAPPLHLELDGERWDDQVTPVYREYIDLKATQCIMYTSGTTGLPKGALISFGNHLWGALGSAIRLGVQPNDRWLTPLPLFHVGGQSVLLRSVIYGTTAMIHASFDPVEVNRAIDEDGVTLLSVVPTMLTQMLRAKTKAYPTTLRNILLGGGPAARSLLEVCVKENIPVSQSYGLTESNSQVATLGLEDSLRKLGSAGQPLAFTEVRIMGKDGLVPSYQEGEIILRGPTIVSGYAHNPKANEQAFRDGWFYTGDIGYVDDEGYLFVLDRRADLIISGGENVYPAEIEATLLTHEDVVEAGVAGMADERFGQIPFAVVTLRAGATLNQEALEEYCRQRLAGYKVPKRIVTADALPRNASGKLLRRELHSWL
ncbi:MAG: o-succinylbenzoate--CoA ligase [Acidibacillus sp.]|nr:o-succinylbenzoate--CoA ligase [Acidibacillus sp.]